MPKVSICMLTIDRYQLTKFCLDNLICKSGIDRNDIELLMLDNGSKDDRTWKYATSVADIYDIRHKNIGVSKGFNELFRLATGEYICIVGNDILVEQNWLKDLLYYQQIIPRSGLSNIYCLLDKGKFNKNAGIYVPDSGLVYGVSLFSRKLLDKIGGFDETLTGYGYEDSQFAWRAKMTGHLNYYIQNQNSYHLDWDQDSTSDYRKHKDLCLKNNLKVFQASIARMQASRNFKIKL